MPSMPLSPAVVALLSPFVYRQDAARQICLIPLGGLYWEDEMPEMLELFKLAPDDRHQVFRLFGIRYTLWDGGTLDEDDQQFWDGARSQIPLWALFHRVEISAADRQAYEKAQQTVIDEFESLSADADTVTVSDRGHGIQSFSATFDLTKTEPIAPKKKPWWKRMLS
jgi:hypothetical protein